MRQYMTLLRVSYKSERWLMPSLLLPFAVASGSFCSGDRSRGGGRGSLRHPSWKEIVGGGDARERTGLDVMSITSASSLFTSPLRLRLRVLCAGGGGSAVPLASALGAGLVEPEVKRGVRNGRENGAGKVSLAPDPAVRRLGREGRDMDEATEGRCT